MKRIIPLILVTLLFACKNHTETKRVKGNLNYATTAIKSGQISVTANLTATIKTQELQADLQLSNPGSTTLTISEIEIATTEGLRTIPKTGTASMILKPGENKAVLLNFQPLNELRENQLTGRNGYLKGVYNLLITYKTEEKESGLSTYSSPSQTYKSPTVMSLPAVLAPSDYKAYLKKYQITATSYSFNTKSDFTAKQKAYLTTLKQIKQSPFVFVSAQEIALSGVNFRLRSYCENDTLNAEIFIVNHSDFSLKINQEKLDIRYPGELVSARSNALVKVEKISGSRKAPYEIEKGDRVLIRLKKPFKNNEDNAVLLFNKAFTLNNQIALFKNNIELVKVNLP
ncbi:hypothetical protein HDE68_003059 [Pedobacter cryoconitis]|uniref:Lipoprotein n=1 Tax=Pedobacter cryoconitis TaxID=188932 RepID=A0A7W9DZM4_9SPHI|nr:hypothetical protein [Pedobacter cryoconitis]MBB5637146.1 hypothetical protein [Pedobacter cryoconitis]